MTQTPRPINSLANTSNRFTPLHYQNTQIGPRDFISQSSNEESHYIDKSEDLPIMVIEKPWIQVNPKQLASTLFPL